MQDLRKIAMVGMHYLNGSTVYICIYVYILNKTRAVTAETATEQERNRFNPRNLLSELQAPEFVLLSSDAASDDS